MSAPNLSKSGDFPQKRRKNMSKSMSSLPPVFNSGSNSDYAVRAAKVSWFLLLLFFLFFFFFFFFFFQKAESLFTGPSPHIVVGFAFLYIFFVVGGVCFLVIRDFVSVELILLIPVTLGLLMLVWLAFLSWPLRYRYNTISSACSHSDFLRIILVFLSCLLSTSLAAVLADEFQRHRNPKFFDLAITEMIFVLLVPLTGIFPTVEVLIVCGFVILLSFCDFSRFLPIQRPFQLGARLIWGQKAIRFLSMA